MSGDYYKFGGLRVKYRGRGSKEDILKALSNVLDDLEKDCGVVSFSGVNLYFQMYDEDNDRLLIEAAEEQEINTIVTSSEGSMHSLADIGIVSEKVKVVKERARKIKAELREAQEKSRLHYQKKHEEERQQLEKCRIVEKMICEEFAVDKFSRVGSSVGRIIDRKAMLKYLSESELPEAGAVIRASLKDPETNKVWEYRIYNEDLSLVKMIRV